MIVEVDIPRLEPWVANVLPLFIWLLTPLRLERWHELVATAPLVSSKTCYSPQPTANVVHIMSDKPGPKE